MTTVATEAYPRFGDTEMARRRATLAAELEAADCGHAVLYGANRAGPAVGWLTRWPVTREALCVFTPGERDLLLVNFYNHVPNAALIATEAEVRWAGPKADGIGGRGARAPRRPGPARGGDRPARIQALRGARGSSRRRCPSTRPTRACGCASPRRSSTGSASAAASPTRAVRAVHEQAAPGTDERELGNLAERAYVGRGGTTHILNFGTGGVPAQWPAARALELG